MSRAYNRRRKEFSGTWRERVHVLLKPRSHLGTSQRNGPIATVAVLLGGASNASPSPWGGYNMGFDHETKSDVAMVAVLERRGNVEVMWLEPAPELPAAVRVYLEARNRALAAGSMRAGDHMAGGFPWYAAYRRAKAELARGWLVLAADHARWTVR